MERKRLIYLKMPAMYIEPTTDNFSSIERIIDQYEDLNRVRYYRAFWCGTDLVHRYAYFNNQPVVVTRYTKSFQEEYPFLTEIKLLNILMTYRKPVIVIRKWDSSI